MRAIALIIPLLFACNEQGFRVIAPEGPDPVVQPSPWDHTDGSDLTPELYTVIAWNDVTGVTAIDDDNDNYPCLPGPTLWKDVRSQTRIDLLDVRGTSLAQLRLDEPLHPGADVRLQALGPESFLVHAQALNSRQHVVWHVDAVSMQASEVLRFTPWSGTSTVWVQGQATQLPIRYGELASTIIDDLLYISIYPAGSVQSPALDDARIVAIDLDSHEQTVWTKGDLMPDSLRDVLPTPRLLARDMKAVDGRLVLQGTWHGPSWTDPTTLDVHSQLQVVFDPNDAQLGWVLDIADDNVVHWALPPMRLAPQPAALLHEYSYNVPDPELLLFAADNSVQTITPRESSCLRGLAVLDAGAPTLIYATHRGPDDYGTTITVNHRGRDVWTVDAVQVGLSERRALIQDLVVLR